MYISITTYLQKKILIQTNHPQASHQTHLINYLDIHMNI